ncbi:MAG: YdcF family protein [Bacteroidales bacterium]|nr:YdcF family protein [Bacteroidales bacterium]
MELNTGVLRLAQKIWNYHHLNHSLEKSDLILVLGSHDLRVAERAVELYRKGMAPYILFSGKRGALTSHWKETEAKRFAAWAMKAGVPAGKILVEPHSVNTGENVRFSYRLLAEKHKIPQKLILVQKPYMERRTYATFLKQWPDKKAEIFVTSPQIAFMDYPTKGIPMAQVIHIIVGDLYRIKAYPAKGFQIEQEIPQSVWQAFLELKKKGFTDHLPPEARKTR